MTKAHELGRHGEDIAVHFLAQKKHILLERNWRWQKAEIDIITQHNNILILVEVKTRSSDYYGLPKEFVSARKQELMKDAAEAYLETNNLELEIRFDVISIVIKHQEANIEHLENAF